MPTGVSFQSCPVDSPDVVCSVVPGYFYPCPDVKTLDGHITMLASGWLGPGSNLTPARRTLARRDIDQLLERRLYLLHIPTAA